jgi:hypothetical protein
MIASMHPVIIERASTLGEGAALLAGLAALLVILSAARRRWRETLGRRADRYARLARLGTGAHLSFFSAVLGEPPAMRSSVAREDYAKLVSPEDPDFDAGQAENGMQWRHVRKRFLVSTFIDRDYYVQVISDDDETVLAFSVTTRSKRFQPVLQVPFLIGRFERWRWRRRYGQPYKPPVYLKLGRKCRYDLAIELGLGLTMSGSRISQPCQLARSYALDAAQFREKRAKFEKKRDDQIWARTRARGHSRRDGLRLVFPAC